MYILYSVLYIHRYMESGKETLTIGVFSMGPLLKLRAYLQVNLEGLFQHI